MYAAFDKADCDTQQAMTSDYNRRQEYMFNNRIDAVSTFRRCFKETNLEQQMRLDQFRVRNYQQWDCDYSTQKMSALDAAYGTPLQQVMGKPSFNTSSKKKTPYTQCQYKDMVNTLDCSTIACQTGPNALSQ